MISTASLIMRTCPAFPKLSYKGWHRSIRFACTERSSRSFVPVLRKSTLGVTTAHRSVQPWIVRALPTLRSSNISISQQTYHDAAQTETGEHPAKLAWQRGTLGYGFSAGGLLFSYFTGVVEALTDAGMLRVGSQVAGSSAGALVAAAINCGLPPREMLQLCIDMVHDCKENGTMYRLGPVLNQQLEKHLPDDAHERCSGRTHVFMTRLFPTVKSVMKSEFSSKQDLISALLTSCHIPYYFNGNWATRYQDGWYADGALLQPLPAPPGMDYTVKICCFPTKLITTYFEGIDISIAPVAEEEFSHQLWEYFGWAVLPSSEQEMTRLHEKGRRDASLWAKQIGVVEAAPASSKSAAK